MKPIIFSGEMVQALLRTTKTQTRRVIKPPPKSPFQIRLSKCPYGKKGDKLWVREKLTKWYGSYRPGCTYDADRTGVVGIDPPESYCGRAVWQWKRDVLPAIFMPKWARRITLEITEVWAETLHHITEANAQHEGWFFQNVCLRERYDPVTMTAAADWFAEYWDEINKKPGCTWDDDPWVWVVEFRVDDIRR